MRLPSPLHSPRRALPPFRPRPGRCRSIRSWSRIDADHRTGSVTVRNEEATPVTVRAYPLAWAQSGGNDDYTETSAVIVSPPVVTIAPGAT